MEVGLYFPFSGPPWHVYIDPAIPLADRVIFPIASCLDGQPCDPTKSVTRGSISPTVMSPRGVWPGPLPNSVSTVIPTNVTSLGISLLVHEINWLKDGLCLVYPTRRCITLEKRTLFPPRIRSTTLHNAWPVMPPRFLLVAPRDYSCDASQATRDQQPVRYTRSWNGRQVGQLSCWVVDAGSTIPAGSPQGGRGRTT